LPRSDGSGTKLVERYGEVFPLLEQIVAYADSNREALGFLPKSVFQDFARRGDLCALLVPGDPQPICGGYLLFQRRFPRASILQMFVAPAFRGRGYARILCDHLVSTLTQAGFSSIYARVGEDLSEANDRWQSLGFRVQRVEPGGVTTGRTIVVRVRELESPQLFPSRALDPGNPLGLRTPTTETPLFLIDLNVLFDLAPRRARREDAVALFKAERMNFCRLAISDELLRELARTALAEKTDPMLSLASTFTTFPVPSDAAAGEVFEELVRMVFPGKPTKELTSNDVSDLRHLVTAVSNNLAGLITNDQAVLDSAPDIEARFGVQVLSPHTFTLTEPPSRMHAAFEVAATDLLLSSMSDSDGTEVRALISRMGVGAVELTSGWLSPRSDRSVTTQCVVRNRSELLGYMTWPALKQGGTFTVRAAVDESNEFAREAARALMTRCMDVLVREGPMSIRLKIPRQQVNLREISFGLGFCAVQDDPDLMKLALNRIVFSRNWSNVRSELASISNLRMDAALPLFRRIDQQVSFITPRGDRSYESLERIETLLSPALFCLSGRPAVITPIRYEFSQRLLGHSLQTSFLPASTSNLFQERIFVSGPVPFKYLTRGVLVLFYESRHPRGSGEIVVMARVRRSYLKSSAALERSDLTQSVLTPESLPRIGTAAMKTVTVFDNVIPLPHPVSRHALQHLGCGRPNDLITTRPIDDGQLQAILSEAFKHGS
jgi:GNAT superfamily N-acetyltransferase